MHSQDRDTSAPPLLRLSRSCIHDVFFVTHRRVTFILRYQGVPVLESKLRPEDEICLMPTTLKSEPRMESRHCCARYDNHRTLKDHERNLFVEKLAIESTAELRNSKDASDEDGESRETQALFR